MLATRPGKPVVGYHFILFRLLSCYYLGLGGSGGLVMMLVRLQMIYVCADNKTYLLRLGLTALDLGFHLLGNSLNLSCLVSMVTWLITVGCNIMTRCVDFVAEVW